MIVPEIQAPPPASTTSQPASVNPAASPAWKPAGKGEKKIEGKAKHQWRAGYQALERHIAGFERRIERMEDEPRRYRTRSTWNVRLERIKRQLEQAEAARQAYEDRARRAGVPPGWLR
jgi:TolA-binding protein